MDKEDNALDGSKTHKIQLPPNEPAKGHNIIFRLYGLLESFYDKTWKPGDPEIAE